MDEQQQTELKINDVKDEQGKTVPDGGNTESTALTLYGSAEANSVVLIVDNGTMTGTASVTINGTWEKSVTLTPGVHVFNVRTPAGETSPSWTVTQQADPLIIDTSPMILNGLAINGLPGWTRTAYDSPGNVAYRPASGGTPPYTYFSSAPVVASVDSNGKVTGNANGSARITVQDSAQRSASYPVSVSNVWRMVANDGPVTFTQAMAWVSQIGGRQITATDVQDFYVRHTRPFPLSKHHWLYGSPGYYVYFSYDDQQEYQVPIPDHPTVQAAWCVLPA